MQRELLKVLHADDDLLFVDKPAGIVVQRGWDPVEPALFEIASEWARERGRTAHLLQRLDRGTTGAMFFSLSAEMNVRITRGFERREIRKSYLALVRGRIGEPMDIDAPIARIGAIKFGVRPEGRVSRTIVTPLVQGPSTTLVSLSLLSGRTHQIRVHMAHAGFPLAGDWLYGERDADRPMLHSWRLDMPHPRTRAALAIEAPIPADFLREAEDSGLDPVAIGHHGASLGGPDRAS